MTAASLMVSPQEDRAPFSWDFLRVQELEEQVRSTKKATICALNQMLDLKDLNTGVHSTRLAEWAVRIGRELGLEETGLEDVEVAALLHDAGKVGVPDAILRKPGPLDAEEWRVMRMHPEFSWAVPVAPTALAFAASRKLGCGLAHALLVGDNNCGQLYRFTPDAARDSLAFSSPALLDHVADNGPARCSNEMNEILFGGGFGAITDLKNGPDGLLYLVAISQGRIYRIGPNPGAFPDADGDSVNDACDCAKPPVK